MKIQQIRNATVIIEYNGVKFLVDPFLGEKGAYPAFPSLRGDENNPLVELPESIDSIIQNIDIVIVTHTHIDHWDPKAVEVLDKNLPIIVQNNYDADIIKRDGFNNVTMLKDETEHAGVTLTKTPGKHYVDEETKEHLNELTGVTETMGVVFSSESEDTLYLAGDTIWYEGMKEAIDTHQPAVIILNAGGNQFATDSEDPEKGRLLINAEETYEVHKTLPKATIIASHMEAVNHWMTSREDLRGIAEKNDFSNKLLVPEDGETYEF